MVHESTSDRFVEHLQYEEFVMTAKNDKFHKSSYKYWDNNDSWYGDTKNIQETIDYAINGWDAGLDMIEDDDIKLNVYGNVKTINDIAGALVDVGGFVSGRPDHMVTFVDEVNRNKPELTIYVDIAYHAGWSPKRIMKYTIDIMNKVNKLQANYDVRIVAVCTLHTYSGDKSNYGELFIDVKHLDQPFVINSIAFSFHPSFFRRLWHCYLNCRKEIATGGGAGLCSKSRVNESIKRFHNREHGTGAAIILPSLQNDGGELGDLSKYTTINFHDNLEDKLKGDEEKS